MSEHKLNIDVQEMAASFKVIRDELDLIEHIIQESLIKEIHNGDNVD